MARKPGVLARWSARRGYLAAREEAVQARVEFIESGLDSAGARRDALLWRANCERTMSDTAFGFRDADQPCGPRFRFTLAESHDLAALLLTMVADTEIADGAVVDAGQLPPVQTRVGTLDDDPALTDILAQLCAPARSLLRRGVLTMALWDVVVGRVGYRAARVLADEVAYGYFLLAGVSPEHARWLTSPDGARWTS